jgi:hypothetical protein
MEFAAAFFFVGFFASSVCKWTLLFDLNWSRLTFLYAEFCSLGLCFCGRFVFASAGLYVDGKKDLKAGRF